MKRILSTATALMLLAGWCEATAQKMGPYRFEVTSGVTYTPLTTGTVVSPGLIWTQPRFKIPLGFTAKLGNTSITHLSVVNHGMAIGTDTIGTIQAFTSFLTTLRRDRYIDSKYSSPIRYTVTGSSPNRIFKLEIFNAGFDEEHYTYGTSEDSVNIQYWLYESSNVFEMHYGGSKLSYPELYFPSGKAPEIGFLVDFNIIPRTISKFYLLKGAAAAPLTDSVTSLSGSIPTLSAYPSEGTVYRFIPESPTSGIGDNRLIAGLEVYPTQTSGTVQIRYAGEKEISLSIRDASGRELARQEYQKGTHLVDLSPYPAGIYLLDVKNQDHQGSYKVLKQ